LYGCDTWSLILREERRLKVTESSVLRRIFGSKRDEVTEKWRKLNNEELNDVCYSSNIIRVIRSRKMRWDGYVACMGEIKMHIGFWWGNLRKRDHFEDPVVDWRIILRWIFRKWDGGAWNGLIWFRIGTSGGRL